MEGGGREQQPRDDFAGEVRERAMARELNPPDVAERPQKFRRLPPRQTFT